MEGVAAEKQEPKQDKLGGLGGMVDDAVRAPCFCLMFQRDGMLAKEKTVRHAPPSYEICTEQYDT